LDVVTYLTRLDLAESLFTLTLPPVFETLLLNLGGAHLPQANEGETEIALTAFMLRQGQ
jgi:hypothetical protein